MNTVRLYSNGTAVIGREYAFQDDDPLKVSIPVRKSDLDEVISSLAVFGDVMIADPPSYSPTNARESTLQLDHADVLRDLVIKLAGASVEIDAESNYKGTLVGLDRSRRQLRRVVVENRQLVIMTEQGLRQIEVDSVTAIRFPDPTVRAEVEGALRKSIARIKPDRSLVELTIRPKVGAKSAFLTYAIPVAAWKIRYHLRLAEAGSELEGQAIVDNDTDDTWSEAMITVISGEPITFSTDLAEARRPARNRVNVVADRAEGAVSASPLFSSPHDPILDEMRVADFGEYAGALPPSPFAGGIARMSPAPPAVQEQAEVRESDDFSSFTSPRPITIAAEQSAIIPLFRSALGEASPVLFYKEPNPSGRPFRAVRVKNDSAHSWGRGVCEVFIEGDFQGKCILEPTKPGEEVLLIHAKDTGVRIAREAGGVESFRRKVGISEGSVYLEHLRRKEVTYRVRNAHAEAFDLEVEHLRFWSDSTLDITASSGGHETAVIQGGERIRLHLDAKGSLVVRVKEQNIFEQEFALGAAWLGHNLESLGDSALDDGEIRVCMELQAEIDGAQEAIKEKETAAKTLVEEQDRLMKLIPNALNEQANAWRADLALAEKEIRQIKRSALPKLRERLRQMRQDLLEALGELQFGPTDDTP